MWRRRRRKGTGHTSTFPQAIYSTEPSSSALQHEFDVALEDLRRRQDEIHIRLGYEMQTFVLMFAAVAAVIGSQVLAQSAPRFGQTLHHYPWAMILIACLLLWFPATNTIAWADIGVAAAYINQVAAPRLRLLIDLEREQFLTAHLRDIVEQRELTELGDWRSHLAWEAYRSEYFYRQNSKFALYPLWIFRTVLLFVPSTLAILSYIELHLTTSHGRMTWIDAVVIVIFIILFAVITVALLTVANLPQIHVKRPDAKFHGHF